MVDGALMAASGYPFSSTVLARSTAGQTTPLRFQKPNSGPLHPWSGNPAATAPAGQRPSAGMVASCGQEMAPAGTGVAGPFPFSPRPWNVPGMDNPGSARTTTTLWTPAIACSRAVSGATDAADPAPVEAGRVGAPTGWPLAVWTWTVSPEPSGCWSASWLVSMLTTVPVPNLVWFTVSWVAIATTAAVVMSRASTRPLTARKAALGSSARRRAAISVAGRLASRAITRAATMVSHGPAMTRPTMISR